MTSTTPDLVRALRDRADELEGPANIHDYVSAKLLREAATRIEELSAQAVTDTKHNVRLRAELNTKRIELAQLRAERREHYTSTACMHAQHESCRRQCKFCGRDCLCSCHAALDAERT